MGKGYIKSTYIGEHEVDFEKRPVYARAGRWVEWVQRYSFGDVQQSAGLS